jgi:two-component system CheB/CheR fusion protein
MPVPIRVSPSNIKNREEERRHADRRFAASPVDCKLVATLAHEINNPLDALQNLLFLMKGEISEKGREYLALAEEEVRRVSQIAYSALHASDAHGAATKTNVPRLLRSVIDFYNVRFETRGISVNSRYCSDGDLAVHAGPLRQVFSNLLLNAVDSVPRGGQLYARVSTAHEWTGQQRHGLRVTIADNGAGIEPENLHKILEPFFTTKGGRGSGLGLSLVRDVVREHGGTLRVRSSTKPGHTGSIYFFRPRMRKKRRNKLTSILARAQASFTLHQVSQLFECGFAQLTPILIGQVANE